MRIVQSFDRYIEAYGPRVYGILARGTRRRRARRPARAGRPTSSRSRRRGAVSARRRPASRRVASWAEEYMDIQLSVHLGFGSWPRLAMPPCPSTRSSRRDASGTTGGTRAGPWRRRRRSCGPSSWFWPRSTGALRPLGLTFARYEALVLLLFSEPGFAAAGQDGRAADGPPDQRHEHRRPARARRTCPAGGPRRRPAHHPGRAHRRRARAVRCGRPRPSRPSASGSVSSATATSTS